MKKYVLPVVIQAVVCFALSFLVFLSRPLRAVYIPLLYVFLSLFSAYTAYRIVRRGINPYAAWIMPPVCEAAAGFLASMGYSPDFLAVLITAFVSLVAAASADVMNRQKKKASK